jgi:hypothetical protein
MKSFRLIFSYASFLLTSFVVFGENPMPWECGASTVPFFTAFAYRHLCDDQRLRPL